MKIAYVYIKFKGSLHELAKYLRDKFNISEKNKVDTHLEQYRFGLNMGGEYYNFEFFGLELKVIINKGEVFESGHKEYNYYLVINQIMEVADDSTFNHVILFLVELLKSDKFITEFEII